MDADANAGQDPESNFFLDTAPGGFFFDLTQPWVLQAVRLYDLIAVEYVAATLPAYAWGPYLDYLGETWTVPRKDASPAGGTVAFTGTNGTIIPPGTEVGTVQIDPDSDPITFVTTASGTISGGTVSIPVIADVAGASGNVGAGTVSQLLSPVDGVTAVTNASALTGGADEESDELYQERLLKFIGSPQGGGNMTDYERWALEEPTIGYVTVEAVWSGPGTVRVIITDRTNRPVAAAVVTALQAKLDPVAGQGMGVAPIGATVTVATPANLNVNVAADVAFRQGYTLTGTGGTIAIQQDITDAIKSYVDYLPPGQDVYVSKIVDVLVEVDGVDDVLLSSVLLNGANTNLAVGSLQVALTGTVTIT
jgi:uncharacterized phage protein gp47/JayE